MESEQSEPSQISILDWLKSIVRGQPIPIPSLPEDRSEDSPARSAEAPPAPSRAAPTAGLPAAPGKLTIPGLAELTPAHLRLPAALLLAMVGHLNLQTRSGLLAVNVGMYLVAGGLAAWGVLAGDLRIPWAEPEDRASLGVRLRSRLLVGGLLFGSLTFLTAGGNRFRPTTVVSWLATWAFVLAALWQGPAPFRGWVSRIRSWLAQPEIHWRPSGWTLVLIGGLAVVALFRLGGLATVPYEMWSDHAEKLLDVRDVLAGQTKIFFERNSGREAIEFYWVALSVKWLGAGMDFLTLKSVTATAGFLALPFIYLLGKEIGGRRAGLFALLLAGMAAWPNITSRAGLRMPLNELAVAPALYLLVRGLRRRERNYFLWSGAVMGLGFHGYTGVRVLPLLLLVALGLYLLHADSRGNRREAIVAFSLLAVVGIVGLLPLVRVVIDMPEQVLYRTLTRVSTLERPYPSPPLLQYLRNNWDALLMFGWDNGETWIVSVAHRPALGWISGPLFHLGVVWMVLEYLRNRRWEFALLLLAIPVLLLPSTMALAFPVENPGPNRVTATIIPVFIVAGLALDAVFSWTRRWIGGAREWVAPAVVGALLLGVGLINYHLVFNVYGHDQRRDVWNNSEAGAVMKGFAHSLGSFDTTYFVAYPYWIDTRLAAIEAGAPIRDYAYWPDQIAELPLDPSRYHLFFIKPEDTEAMEMLASDHPNGVLTHVPSAVAGRDFYLFLVPPSTSLDPADIEGPSS